VVSKGEPLGEAPFYLIMRWRAEPTDLYEPGGLAEVLAT